MATTQKAIQVVIERLCNAKCMLDVTIKAHSEIVVDGEEWEINEALRGISHLLDDCYGSLVEATHEEAEAMA
ncbi:hypothetical protein [Pseudoxanthomonas mexicana]